VRGGSRTHDSLAAHFEIEPFVALAPGTVISRKTNDGLSAALRLGRLRNGRGPDVWSRVYVGAAENANWSLLLRVNAGRQGKIG